MKLQDGHRLLWMPAPPMSIIPLQRQGIPGEAWQTGALAIVLVAYCEDALGLPPEP